MTCIDFSRLALGGSTKQSVREGDDDNNREGDVFLGSHAICDEGWQIVDGRDNYDDEDNEAENNNNNNNNAAKLVCNIFFEKDFKGRGSVPLFRTTSSS